MSTAVRGADVVVRALQEAGVRYVFGVTGNTVLDILDALHGSDIPFITTHQERVAVAMADGYTRASGQLAATLFHVGPGIVAALTGVLDAWKEGTPHLVLSGNLQRNKLGWDAWHEVDILAVTRPLTKWNRQVQHTGEIAAVMRAALHQATAPRQGPVHVDIPQDLLHASLEPDQVPARILYPHAATLPAPDAAAINAAATLLARARRPLLICGEGAVVSAAGLAVTTLAEALQAPVVTTEIARGLVPEDHPLSLALVGHGGNSTANQALREADLVLGLGCRFSNFMTINDRLIQPHTSLVQVEIAPEEVRGRLQADLVMVGNVATCASQLLAAVAAARPGAPPAADSAATAGSVDGEWVAGLQMAWRQELGRFYATDLETSPTKPQRIIRAVTNVLARDAIVVSGCGMHQHWVGKVPVRAARSFLQASTSGSIGWALGAAAGAKLACPERQVVALVGDGDFASVLPDLETAVRCHLGIVYVVMNDSGYGALRTSQRRSFGGRFIGNDFPNPDFGRVASLYGAAGVRISRPAELDDALAAALARPDVPTVIDVPYDDQEPYYRASEFGWFHG